MKIVTKKLVLLKDTTGIPNSVAKDTELEVIGLTEKDYEVLYKNQKLLVSKEEVEKGTNFTTIESKKEENKTEENKIKNKEQYTQAKFDFLEKKEKEIDNKESFLSKKVLKLDEETAHLKAKFFDLIATEMQEAVEQYRTQFEVDFEILLKESKDVEKFAVVGYVKEVMLSKGFEVEETPSSLVFK